MCSNHKPFLPISLLLPALCLLGACSAHVQQAELLHRPAPVWPDYTGVTVPCNLAPPRFTLPDSCRLNRVQAVFAAGSEQCVQTTGSNGIAIGMEDWHRLCAASDTVMVRIQGRQAGRWVEYDPFCIYVSADSINPYLAYRLIEPGHEIWHKIQLCQRNLETYEETAFLDNNWSGGTCMNCHSFHRYSPQTMLLHMRRDYGGTYVLRDGQVERLNTKTPETISALVYPSWSSSGRFVAFSTNSTKQGFHSTDRNRVEVFDLASDVVVYDVERHCIFSCPRLQSRAAFETFPVFAPDDRAIYFCSADSVPMPEQYDSVHYSLCRIAFDPDAAMAGRCSDAFVQQVDTLYDATARGGSISFPRVSPDGHYLLYTHSSYGNFSIWHRDADLRMTDLRTGRDVDVSALCSPETESYHSWSSNSRWVVISTRRDDGLYTRLYLAHVDSVGHCSKPTPLPQEDALHDLRLMKSYNIPEFVDDPVSAGPAFVEAARTQPGTDLQFAH